MTPMSRTVQGLWPQIRERLESIAKRDRSRPAAQAGRARRMVCAACIARAMRRLSADRVAGDTTALDPAALRALIARLERLEQDLRLRVAARAAVLDTPVGTPRSDPLYQRLFFTHAKLLVQLAGANDELSRSTSARDGYRPKLLRASTSLRRQFRPMSEEFSSVRNILVPTDGSAASVAGALRAVRLAKLASARITVVYVQDIYPYTGVGQSNAAGLDNYLAAARTQGTRAFEPIEKEARLAGVAITTLIVEDSQAARGIVSAAQSCGADLIVMGSHGRTGVAKLVRGSVATKVLKMSPVPVLIVMSAPAAG